MILRQTTMSACLAVAVSLACATLAQAQAGAESFETRERGVSATPQSSISGTAPLPPVGSKCSSTTSTALMRRSTDTGSTMYCQKLAVST